MTTESTVEPDVAEPDVAEPDVAEPAGAAAPSVSAGHLVRAGRPRDEGRERAILDATIGLLAEVGYDRMTMDGVAAAAHASKATLYRRWPGKAELVVEALRHHTFRDEAIPDLGSLRAELEHLVVEMHATLAGVEGGLIMGLIAPARTDANLASLLENEFVCTKDQVLDPVIDRAVRRGEVPTGASGRLVMRVLPAVLLLRVLFGQPNDGAYTAHVVDDIALPLLRSGRPGPPPPPT